jgi:hypothetical protein
MKIKIFETVSLMPNGDRDTQRHPSSAFEVVLENDKGDKFTVFKNNQFDSNWCSIKGSRQGHLNAAFFQAEELATVLGDVEILGPDVTKKEKDIMDIQARIERDKKELERLLQEK